MTRCQYYRTYGHIVAKPRPAWRVVLDWLLGRKRGATRR